NKFDRKGAADALRDVRKQYQRNRELFSTDPDEMPVCGTIASRFNDDGVMALYQALVGRLTQEGLKLAGDVAPAKASDVTPAQGADDAVAPAQAGAQVRPDVATTRLDPGLRRDDTTGLRRDDKTIEAIDSLIADRESKLDPRCAKLLAMWPQTKAAYTGDEY